MERVNHAANFTVLVALTAGAWVLVGLVALFVALLL